ncbi:MAG: DUF5106 domain-containing protein [Bacteroidales bacterium]|nr:DUF5106 domain-containing protein [Bacteroidales bacterium]MDD4603126.1 DUF5106 domain-containing protein [Bacteroidales bacterium]
MQKHFTTLQILVFVCLFIPAMSQQDYLIKFRIKGIKDTTCIIANYYGNGTYVKDSIKVDGNGKCVFKAKTDLPKGMYIFIISEKNYFDFIVNDDHKFSMETDVQNPIKNMIIRDSPENSLFYQYLRYNKEQYDIMMGIQDHLKKVKENNDSVKILSDQINQMNKDLIAYKLDLIKEHPRAFLNLLINTMKEPEIKDSTTTYQYYKEHFWDDVDFTDDRILRTPVFHPKLKKYFDNVLIQIPDSIIHESDIMIDKSRPNSEMFKYLVWFMTSHYENSEIMGFDKIFVHVVDTYYSTGQATWVSKTTTENIIKKSDRLKPILLGKKAPNMIMQDTSFRLVSMHNINAKYLVILFWDPSCGHCEHEIPKIKAFYDVNKEKYGLEVLAVCSDTSLVKWKEAIKSKHLNWINVDGPRTLTGDYHEQYDVITTPVLYLLDERKVILAKQLPWEKMEKFLENRYNENK